LIIVDTSIWIDFFRGSNTKARYTLHNLISQDEEIYITEIILTEILQGIKNDKEYYITKEYLLNFPILKPTGIQTYIMAADIYRKCRKEGKTVRKTIDCIISAIAIENNAILVHKDHDFEIIKDCTELKTLYLPL